MRRVVAEFFFGLAIILISAVTARSEPTENNSQSTGTLWSIPRFSIRDGFQTAEGTVTILVENDQQDKALLMGANEAGPGHLVALPEIAKLLGSELRMVEGASETVWIAGTTSYRKSLSGNSLSDIYIAQFDNFGNVNWQREFDRGHKEVIQGLSLLRGGDVAVVGIQDDHAWLARISTDGKIIWEKTFGLGKIASVVVESDEIVVGAFEATSEFEARVAIWRFSESGELLQNKIIRDEIAREPFCTCFMRVFAGKNGEIYLFSAWTELKSSALFETAPKPLNISKVDKQGNIIWSRNLPDTVRQDIHGGLLRHLSFTVLSNGDAIVDCESALEDIFFQLASKSGAITQSSQANPQRQFCVGLQGTPIFVTQKSDRYIWILGAGRNCMWFDQQLLMKMNSSNSQ